MGTHTFSSYPHLCVLIGASCCKKTIKKRGVSNGRALEPFSTYRSFKLKR
jgi:hypothetical protein